MGPALTPPGLGGARSAIVVYTTAADAAQALNLHGADLRGAVLTVTPAPKPCGEAAAAAAQAAH